MLIRLPEFFILPLIFDTHIYAFIKTHLQYASPFSPSSRHFRGSRPVLSIQEAKRFCKFYHLPPYPCQESAALLCQSHHIRPLLQPIQALPGPLVRYFIIIRNGTRSSYCHPSPLTDEGDPVDVHDLLKHIDKSTCPLLRCFCGSVCRYFLVRTGEHANKHAFACGEGQGCSFWGKILLSFHSTLH